MYVSKTNAFKVAYLLGVDEPVLEKEFPEQYKRYEDLVLFDKVEDAHKLRSLSMIRQSLIKKSTYFKKYKIYPGDNTYVRKEEVEYLKSIGYDFPAVYLKLGDLTDVINELTREIDKIALDVLNRCYVELPQKVVGVFYLHILDKKKGLTNFCNSIKGVSFPYNMIIAKHNKIGKTLKYMLLNDINLMLNAYSILGESFSKDYIFAVGDLCWHNYKDASEIKKVDEIIETNEDEKETNNEDNSAEEIIESEEVEVPAEDITEVQEELVTDGNYDCEEIEGSTEEDNNEVIEVEKTATQEVKAVIDVTSDPAVVDSNISSRVLSSISQAERTKTISQSLKDTEKTISDYLGMKKDVTVFVDCDNVDFFTFLGFMSYLEKYKCITEVKLYVDDKSSYLWKSFKDIFASKLPVYVTYVHRVKDNKSLTDMVIATDICTYVLRNKKHNIMLLSSDCDYYGVMENLMPMDNKAIKYAVGYSSVCVSPDYLAKLDSVGIPNFDTDAFADESLIEAYEGTCIKYLVARNIVNVAPIYTNIEKTREIILAALEKETPNMLNIERIDNILSVLREKISFKFCEDNIVEVTVDDVVVRLQQKGGF